MSKRLCRAATTTCQLQGENSRSLGPSLFVRNPKDLLKFDLIELGPSSIGSKYVLMLREDQGGYFWIFLLPETGAKNASTDIIDWATAFAINHDQISDSPIEFCNETVRLVTKDMRVPHKFKLTRSPWCNGSVKRLGKQLLGVTRDIISELRMKFEEWHDILRVIQSAINKVPSPHRGKLLPSRHPMAPRLRQTS